MLNCKARLAIVALVLSTRIDRPPFPARRNCMCPTSQCVPYWLLLFMGVCLREKKKRSAKKPVKANWDQKKSNQQFAT